VAAVILFLSNNQPKDGVRDGGGYCGGCGPVVERMGGAFYHRLGRWHKRQKNIKIYYVMAVNGHQTGVKDSTINKKRARSTEGDGT
jgi:hypothetical protein